MIRALVVRPASLTKLQKRALEVVLATPRSIKASLPQVANYLVLPNLSRDTVRRLLRECHYVWRRGGQSLRDKRKETDFRTAHTEFAALRTVCAAPSNDYDLVYYDEAAFSLTPCILYAWQPRGQRLELPCGHSPRLNVLGFLNLRGPFFSHVIEGRIDTSLMIQAVEAYIAQMEKPTLLALDNDSTHTSGAFEVESARWEQAGLYLYHLPPYCPELNLIELLWRKIKYEWLPFTAYESFERLSDELFEVLKSIGSKHLINFA